MSKYRRDDTQPDSLQAMHAMMSAKIAPPIEDPTTVALRLSYKIYMDMKSSVLLGDKQVETIRGLVVAARERTEKEIAQVKVREAAIAKYDIMLSRLESGGPMEI